MDRPAGRVTNFTFWKSRGPQGKEPLYRTNNELFKRLFIRQWQDKTHCMDDSVWCHCTADQQIMWLCDITNMRHNKYTYVTSHICDITNTRMLHHIYVTSQIHVYDITHMCHHKYTYVTSHTCDITNARMWHQIYVTLQICDITNTRLRSPLCGHVT